MSAVLISDLHLHESDSSLYEKFQRFLSSRVNEFDNLLTFNKDDAEKMLITLQERLFQNIDNFDSDKFIKNFTAKSIVDNLDIV